MIANFCVFNFQLFNFRSEEDAIVVESIFDSDDDDFELPPLDLRRRASHTSVREVLVFME